MQIARGVIGTYAWVWGIIGFLFPVISIFIVAVAGATNAGATSRPPPPLSRVGIRMDPTRNPSRHRRPWCGSMIQHHLDVCPNCAGRQNQ